jgi:hypothetical protein
MATLSLLVPLGGILISRGGSWHWPGLWVILVALITNLIFGSKSLERWLMHRNIDLWLYKGDTDKDYKELYQRKLPKTFPRIRRLIQRLMKTKPEEEKPKNFDEDWEEALKEARRFERLIQILIFAGAIIFLGLLYSAFTGILPPVFPYVDQSAIN